MDVDSYINEIINVGDEGSRLLANKLSPTLKNNQYVRILSSGMNGVAVIDIPLDCDIYVHSAVGNPLEMNNRSYAISVVENLLKQSKLIKAKPIAMANVIDSNDGNLTMLEELADGMKYASDQNGIAIVNGENAILGNRVKSANIAATMISIVEDSKKFERVTEFEKNKTIFAAFTSKGKPLYMNSDGVATKMEIYERRMKPELGLIDSLAMKLDDFVKFGGTPIVVSDTIESNGKKFPEFQKMQARCKSFKYMLNFETVGNRISGFDKKNSYNISGTAVSEIDESIFQRLIPKEGDVLIAIRGKPNPRCNGITAKRQVMTENFGNNWHIKDGTREIFEYLAEPSIIFFPLFSNLIGYGQASSVYHMSGGAYEGKLAKPLAKHGLYARIENLFRPDEREIFFVEKSNSTMEQAYKKWPMGNDAFVTTRTPSKVIDKAKDLGLQAREVGQLDMLPNKTGIRFRAYDGSLVTYSGK